MAYSQYKVIEVAEGGCSTILFGSAPIPVDKLQACLNKEAKEGWQMIFQVIEKKRMLLFWSRESVVVTFGK